jgi:hypothetical protein
MPSNPPVDFEERVKRPSGANNADYPYAIKAADLMRNFVFATLDMDEPLFQEQVGIGGHSQRRLKIQAGNEPGQILYWDGNEYLPLIAPPSSGTHVLGVKDGAIQWIETEDCDDDQA